jgi:transcription initiation factor TFIID TATA-box-binding protein
MIKQTIVNVIATASLNQNMDLEKLCQFKEIIYDKEAYRGLVAYLKTRQMQGKVSIFSSGKMISIGTKSEAQADKELHLANQFLTEKGVIKASKLESKTQNIVVTADFGHEVNLEELSQNTRAIYEPEQFPGAILRLKQPYKASILIFASGKIVITGLKKTEQILTIIEEIQRLID